MPPLVVLVQTFSTKNVQMRINTIANANMKQLHVFILPLKLDQRHELVSIEEFVLPFLSKSKSNV